MNTKWILFFCFLFIVGVAAVPAPAHAQTLTDPTYVIHGSPCVDAFCVEFQYTGSTKCYGFLPCLNPSAPPPLLPPTGSPFLFALASPVTGVPDNELGLFNCSAADLPGFALDDFTFQNNGTATFLGCDYFGVLAAGQTFTWNSSVVSPLAQNGDLLPIPEPNSLVLFTSGLALFALAGFARKRLGASISA
jgi:hypothetical protein